MDDRRDRLLPSVTESTTVIDEGEYNPPKTEMELPNRAADFNENELAIFTKRIADKELPREDP